MSLIFRQSRPFDLDDLVTEPWLHLVCSELARPVVVVEIVWCRDEFDVDVSGFVLDTQSSGLLNDECVGIELNQLFEDYSGDYFLQGC